MLVPLLAVILFLALYPQGALKRSESSVATSVAARTCGPDRRPLRSRLQHGTMIALATLKGPHVDFAALSPLIALLGGAIVVLLVGLLGSPWRSREQVVPALALVALGAAIGTCDLALGHARVGRRRRAADRPAVARR